MKTARDYLDKEYQNDGDRRDLQFEIILNPSLERLEAAINQARKECLQEAAEKSEKYLLHDVCEDDFGIKQFILDLIKELK